MIPRGIRNNNPGNIRKGPSPWLGKKPKSLDPDFEQFDHPRYGIRAMGVLLRTYQRTYKLNTLREIISRYAPHNENNVNAYVKFLTDHMGRSEDTVLDLGDEIILMSLILGIIRYENAEWQPYYPIILVEALDLMGK